MDSDRHRYMLPWATLVHSSLFLLSRLDHAMRDAVGISITEQDFLSQLEKRGGEWTMSDFADTLFLTKGGLTRMVDRLGREELVTRRRSEQDRRVNYVVLTRKGSTLVRRSREVLVAWVERNFAQHLAQEDLDDIQRALQTLLESHGRWQKHMAYLRGAGPHPDKAEPSATEGERSSA